MKSDTKTRNTKKTIVRMLAAMLRSEERDRRRKYCSL